MKTGVDGEARVESILVLAPVLALVLVLGRPQNHDHDSRSNSQTIHGAAVEGGAGVVKTKEEEDYMQKSRLNANMPGSHSHISKTPE
jgi:hypothetical protein